MDNSLDFNFVNDKYKYELQKVNNSIAENQKELNEVRAEKYIFTKLPNANDYFRKQYDTACKREAELMESISNFKDHKANIKRILCVIECNMQNQQGLE